MPRHLSAEMVAEEARQLGLEWIGIDAGEKRKVVEKIIVYRDRQQVEMPLHCMPHIPMN